MGWFATSKTDTSATLTRKERQMCWDTRDAYYLCLDNAGILKPGEEGKACRTEKTAYEENCAKSWIEYFNQRRVLAERQKRMLGNQRS